MANGAEVFVELSDAAAVGAWLKSLSDDVTVGKVTGFDVKTVEIEKEERMVVVIRGTLSLPAPEGLKTNLGKSQARRNNG